MKLAGVKSGEALRGKELALFLVVNRRSLVTMAVVINMVAIVSPIVPTASERANGAERPTEIIVAASSRHHARVTS